MLIAAIILFLIAIAFGLFVLPALLEDNTSHKKAAIAHGTLAISALVFMVIYLLINGSSPLLITSLALLCTGALGGIILFIQDMKKKPVPKILLALHPLIALAGFITLIIYILP